MSNDSRFQLCSNARVGVYSPFEELARSFANLLSSGFATFVTTDIEEVSKLREENFVFLMNGPAVQACKDKLIGRRGVENCNTYSVALGLCMEATSRVTLVCIEDIDRGFDRFLEYFSIVSDFDENSIKAALPSMPDKGLVALTELYLMSNPKGKELIESFNSAKLDIANYRNNEECYEMAFKSLVDAIFLNDGLELLKDQQRSMFGLLERVYAEKDLFFEKKCELQSEIGNLSSELNRIHQQLCDRKRKIKVQENALRERDEMLRVIGNMAVELESRVKELEDSYSFKVTRPLRAFRRLF